MNFFLKSHYLRNYKEMTIINFDKYIFIPFKKDTGEWRPKYESFRAIFLITFEYRQYCKNYIIVKSKVLVAYSLCLESEMSYNNYPVETRFLQIYTFFQLIYIYFYHIIEIFGFFHMATLIP